MMLPGEPQGEAVEAMRRISGPGEEDERSAGTAPIQNFKLNTLFDGDQLHFMRRGVRLGNRKYWKQKWGTQEKGNLPSPTHRNLLEKRWHQYMSDATDNDYISDGVTESSIQQLSGIAGVRVIGSGSVARYKGAQQDVRSVGRTLGVDTVLQGHLRLADGRLMLVIELCRVSDGSVLFSRDYLPEDKDLQPVQADLVRDTLHTLGIDTGTESSKSQLHTHTNNPMAYEEFLRGEAVAQGDSPVELHEAVRHFEKATALDPGFDLAWAALAEFHLMLGIYFEAPREHMEIAPPGCTTCS